jgi:proteasome beta subunit
MSFPSFPQQGRRPPVGLDAYLSAGPSSVVDFLTTHMPHLLPGRAPDGAPRPSGGPANSWEPRPDVPHGTTIVALKFADGVLIAGDRRATQGNVIAQRDVDKIVVTDAYSAAGFAGTAGIGVETVRLFAVELEHYEKIEGTPLSLRGKANKLASMVRANLGAALQGLAAIPLFVGYDLDDENPATAGHIYTYDVTGHTSDEQLAYASIGSGSVFAKSALKKRHDPAADLATTVRTAIEALYDAADDDSATGGPDVSRRIYPTVASITAGEGSVRRSEEEIAEIVAAVVNDRLTRPGG